MKARLGVNIDHVATLRQARGEYYPKVTRAADSVIAAGADQITMHLREDRRHIQDQDMYDVHELTKSAGIPLNFEMGANEDIINVALKVKPEWICLVPEKREEKTTEGGLNLKNPTTLKRIESCMERLRDGIENVKISLFVEAEKETIKLCQELKPEAVEIHTGEYAKDFLEGKDIQKHLDFYKQAFFQLENSEIGFHAGHGLTLESLKPLVEQSLFIEYNIGHALVSESIFIGLETSVKQYLDVLTKRT